MAGPTPDRPLARVAVRGAIGGLLMGLANLVPGISGGTMLLAAGVFPDFVRGISDVTTFRFRPRALVVLGSVGGAAALAILLFAGPVKDLVVSHRWAMYSLFIGLTLGGVPIVRGLQQHEDLRSWIGATGGFLAMAALAWFEASGMDHGGARDGVVWMLLAGAVGASAMILPGVSGGYLLLVMGTYIPILSGIDAVKKGLGAADPAALVAPLTGVVIPVGIGVVAGIAGVAHALRWALDRHRSLPLGVLLGVLVGAVVGLYPFQRAVPPPIGSTVKGRVVTEQVLAELEPEDWPTEWYRPGAAQVVGAVALCAMGLAITLGIRRFSADAIEGGG